MENYSLKEGRYRHLPLETKIEQLEKLSFKWVSVCADVQDITTTLEKTLILIKMTVVIYIYD